MVLAPVLVSLVLTLIHSAVADAARWRAPLAEPRVAREFDFDARAPYAPGALRGVRLAAEPGTLVRAPCSGRVTFAGRHPRLGFGVSLRCGSLVATELGFERLAVRKGATARTGSPVGRLGADGELHLGARLATRRFGYLDPLALIEDTTSTPPALAPPPRRSAPRAPSRPRASRAAQPDTPRGAPPLAWLGVALAGAGAGLGTTIRLRRASRRPGTTPPALNH